MDDLNLDLIVALAAALRESEQQGDNPRSRALLATLGQELHVFGLNLDPGGETCPALIRSNGNLWAQGLKELGVNVDEFGNPTVQAVS